MKNYCVFGVLIAKLLLSVSVVASPKEIGIIPVMTAPDLERSIKKIHFISAEKGEISSSHTLAEPVYYVTLSTDEPGVFYAQTPHYLYKGRATTGEIIERFQYVDILERKPFQVQDPNNNIIPHGVSSTGQALYSFMEGSQKHTIHLVDFDTKGIAYLRDTNPAEERMIGLSSDSKLITWNPQTYTIYVRDVETGATTELNLGKALEGVPELSEMHLGNMQLIAEDLAYYSFATMIGQGGIGILYDFENQKIVSKGEESVYGLHGMYPLAFENSNIMLFADKECPPANLPSSEGYSFSEWDSELQRWSDMVSNPRLCSITIYRDSEKKERIIKLEQTARVTIYHDRYAFADRGDEVALYDMETNDLMWRVSIEY